MNTKPGNVNAVAFDTSSWVCRKPAIYHLVAESLTSHFPDEQNSSKAWELHVHLAMVIDEILFISASIDSAYRSNSVMIPLMIPYQFVLWGKKVGLHLFQRQHNYFIIFESVII